ncbi:MAG: T9SS type A sorting domain-containing protein [Bacteroidota bacterium]
MKLKIPFLVLFLSIHTIAFSQIGFEDHVIADDRYSIENPSSIFSIDLDGDGYKDVLSATKEKLIWQKNIGGLGHFGLENILESGILDATSVYSVDIDNDGDNDIIATLKLLDEVVWYENLDGLGNFSQKQIITSYADSATSVFAADIDGDGNIDVISSSSDDDKIAWYQNLDGQGSFGVQEIISNSADKAESVYAADMDEDGDVDVISISEGDNKLAWYENTDGQGTFTTHVITTALIPTIGVVLSNIHVNDIDNDGDMDILVGSKWFENINNSNTFIPRSIISFTDINAVYSSDIDNDGDIDVLLTAFGDLQLYINTDGLGNFSSPQTITFGSGISDIYTSDIDNDGNIDIIAGIDGSLYEKVAWFKNLDGAGDFSDWRSVTIDNKGARDAFAADIDGDGDTDILTTFRRDNKVVWYENLDGLGSFDIEKIITVDIEDCRSIYGADIDGDGDIDVITASSGDNKLAWYENTDGLGNFGTQQIIDTNFVHPFSEVIVTDINNDSYLDVVSIMGEQIVWYVNIDGLGNFGNQQTLIAIDARSIFVEDIDNDNDVDIIIGDYGTSSISWLENIDGQGSFGDIQIITTETNGVSDVYAADIDGDGNKDVVSVSSDSGSDNKIAWYENTDGQGNFGPQQIIASDYRATHVYVSDIDNDNDMDVISGGFYNLEIVWYENTDGLGNFGGEQIVRDLLYNQVIFSTLATDIDGDLDKDILYVSWDSPQVVWVENTGLLLNTVQGNALIDSDSDGCETSDPGMQNLMIVTDNGINTSATFTQNDGSYTLFVGEGNYSTQIVSSIPSYLSVVQNMQSSNFVGYGNIDDANDFCLQFTEAINDVNITIYPSIDDPRPGFDTTYRIVYSNVGTTSFNGTITFEFDDTKLQFLNASETVVSQTSNTLTFDVLNVQPFQAGHIDLVCNVFPPPTTNIDEILVSTATMNSAASDATPDDNSFTLEQLVIGSYDPNDIRVLEGDEILVEAIDEYLHYIIRFQNTGTASAINVRIDNVLDANLDWTTMQLQSLSHPGRVEITDGNMVEFIFEGINLPDSTNDEPNSHGFITYKIKPKNTVVIGDIINNKADIFFDFNPPIITNTVSTEIVAPLSVTEFTTNAVTIYPNPTNAIVQLKANHQIQKIQLLDISGRLLRTDTLESPKAELTLDLSEYTSGVYFLKIQTDFGQETKKIVKQ